MQIRHSGHAHAGLAFLHQQEGQHTEILNSFLLLL